MPEPPMFAKFFVAIMCITIYYTLLLDNSTNYIFSIIKNINWQPHIINQNKEWCASIEIGRSLSSGDCYVDNTNTSLGYYASRENLYEVEES